MDQLRQVGEFLWKWRFWLCLGVVVTCAIVVQPMGTARVKAMVQQRKTFLDGALNQIQPFTFGEHPNPEWKNAITAKEGEANQRVSEIQENIFKDQEKRMVWPEFAALFNGRPFNSLLNEDQGRHLFTYFRNFDQQVKELRKAVDPITVNDDGTVTGKVWMGDAALEAPKFTEAPKSQAAWLAQEQIWIQRACLEGINKINASSPDWYSAPVREVVAIRLGEGAVDIRKSAEAGGEAKLQTLQPIPGEDIGQGGGPGGGPAATQETTGNVSARYLEVNNDYRLVPVQIILLIDQRKILDVVSGLGAIDFGLVVKEISWTVPSSRVSVPGVLEEYREVSPGVARDALDNTVQLSAYGEMILYEMPPAMKQAYEQSKQPPPPGTPPPMP
jgi:hypothetical protein